MPPYTTLPLPVGTLKVSYNPLSPANWGIVWADIEILVYANVRVALQALLQSATTIHAQRLEKGAAALMSDHIYYRGHTDLTHRLLPTRLRPAHHTREEWQRWSLLDQSDEVREKQGDWIQEMKPRRSSEALLSNLPAEELCRRSEIEGNYIQRAEAISTCRGLSDFQTRAAVRHYSLAPSPLLDVSTNPNVGAFFATGGGSTVRPVLGSIGMLWAIDLNIFSDLFSFEIVSVPAGLKIRLLEMREEWGDNKRMFEDQGILPTAFEVTSVGLPFRRPTAQSARFFALTGEDTVELSAQTELAWWSIVERRAYSCAFIQDGKVYTNTKQNITAEALLPTDEDLARALA
jgi:hypothetical protein